MNKKIIALLLVVTIAVSGVFAVGVGVQFGGGIGNGINGGNIALSLKPNKAPCIFAIDMAIGNNYFDLGVSADWWIQNPTISGAWGWFYGVGAAGYVEFASNSYAGFAIGPRVFIGTNFFINKVFELYLMGGWQPMLGVGFWGNQNVEGGFGWTPLNFPINLGFRFWF